MNYIETCDNCGTSKHECQFCTDFRRWTPKATPNKVLVMDKEQSIAGNMLLAMFKAKEK